MRSRNSYPKERCDEVFLSSFKMLKNDVYCVTSSKLSSLEKRHLFCHQGRKRHRICHCTNLSIDLDDFEYAPIFELHDGVRRSQNGHKFT
jgi:hypothetical protein